MSCFVLLLVCVYVAFLVFLLFLFVLPGGPVVQGSGFCFLLFVLLLVCVFERVCRVFCLFLSLCFRVLALFVFGFFACNVFKF